MITENNNKYILCEDIFKIYKIAELEVVALRGLDLEVNQGEVVAIVGASGSGKSTLLNIIAGYDIPSAGKVEVAGNDLSKLSVKEVESYRRSEIGFIWQQAVRNLFPYLTAQENVELPMLLSGISPKQRKEHSLYLLNLVGLDHRLSHTPQKLSGGEQQRVAIAVALANQPKLILADEPTGELDRKTANTVLELLNKLNSELPPLKEFILPGGSELSARIHLARSECRNTERDLVTLFEKEKVRSNIGGHSNELF